MIKLSRAYASAGDRAPTCVGVTTRGAIYTSEAQAGRAVVMILAQNLSAPELLPFLHAFSAQSGKLSDREVDLVAMIGEDVERVLEYSQQHPTGVTLVGALSDFLMRNGVGIEVPKVLSGSPKEFFEAIGFEGTTPEVLIIDRNQRVAGRVVGVSIEQMLSMTLGVVDAIPVEPPHDIYLPAPVLILPNLLDAELCQELIEMHEKGANSASPSLVFDDYGHPRHKLDNKLKKRRDFLLERDDPMSLRITDILKRRCIPEIKRAFQVEVTHTDRYNVACYPGDGGHFCRHRDNRPELVAFRRFALSINLTSSAEGYEGGFLRLPEFNSHNYRCATGAGVIFSVALLHEITPVLRGNRYVLVTHFHDEEGEARWLEMRKTLAGVA